MKQALSGLSVILDQFLSFDDYISSVCRYTPFHLINIGRIQHLLSQDATTQLIQDLISICLQLSNIQPPEEQHFEITDNSKPGFPDSN